MASFLSSVLCIMGMLALSRAGGRKEVCYGKYGCFSDDSPFEDLYVPESPEANNVRFQLYSRNNRDSLQDITTGSTGNFNSSKPTKVIVHGYSTNPSIAVWTSDLKNELLTESDCNVLVINWGAGAFGRYTQAAGNTRLVGPIIGEKLNELGASVLASTHCIGHSLGAHLCGYAGAWSGGKILRITGLDPAGPNYRGQVPEARLDANDAPFVDNIHTHGEGGFFVDFGIGEPSGDADFYPNGGGIQPGCFTKRKRRSELQSHIQQRTKRGDVGSCSHSRAHWYFIESVNSACAFTAQPCSSWDDARQGTCLQCFGSGCQRMGYHSDQTSAGGIFHLETNAQAAFCKS